MYNQDTRGMATTRHISLVERGERKAFVGDNDMQVAEKLRLSSSFQTKKTGKKMSRKADIHESEDKDSST